jgi:hypothetical protein
MNGTWTWQKDSDPPQGRYILPVFRHHQSCDQHKQKQSNYNYKPTKLYVQHMCIYLFPLIPPKKILVTLQKSIQMGILLPSATPTPMP